MNLISNKSKILLENLPDLSCWEEALQWLQKGQNFIHTIDLRSFSNREILSLNYFEIEQNVDSPFGLYASKNWRAFALSTFFADLVSYPKPTDQVNFERLLFLMHTFPQGFRTWWMNFSHLGWWPVGYTGWYPMLDTQFELFEKSPHKIKDRMVVPDIRVVKHPYIYLFNYSAIASLKGSDLTKSLMEKYVQDIQQQEAKGLACITVSEDGDRVAHRFGMTCSGHLNIDGHLENIYIKTY